MATWDSADLLLRLRTITNRPSTDESMTDAIGYQLLTEGQAHWTGTVAAQCPWVLMGAPTLLTSSDSGETYPFVDASGNSIAPLAVEVYDTKAGRLLKNGAYWDASADYVWESHRIRFPQGALKTFANGPYARYIVPPVAVSAAVAPTLLPAHARLLVVYRAAALWATRGGMRDPSPYYEAERRFWLGDFSTGDVGLLGALKGQNPFLGGAAYSTGVGGILDGVSTGAGHSVLHLGG